MADHFNLVLDTAPPAQPALVLNGGALVTGDPVIAAHLSTDDFDGGAADVEEMLLWGDLDPSANPLVQATEGTSTWIPYAEDYALAVSSGAGLKTVYARLRDNVGNATVIFSDQITLDLTRPIVSITVAVDRGRISKVPGWNVAMFSWQSNQAFVEYVVRAVPTTGSPYNAGVPIGTAHGSSNVAGTGSFPATTAITTSITGTDLEAASPGNTTKIVKVFVLNSTGLWSP